MMSVKSIYAVIFCVILLNQIFSQSIKDVSEDFKKYINEYLSSDEKDTNTHDVSIKIDPSLYDNFQVPEYSFKQLKIGSDEIVNFNKTGDQSTLTINLDGDYNIHNQSLYNTISYSIQPKYDVVKVKDSDLFSSMKIDIPFDMSKYFNDDYSGVQGFTSGSLNMSKIGDTDLANPLDLKVGVGYGRITSVRPIARAIALATKVGDNISNEDLLQIANIITKQNDGYYEKNYKSDANIMFYNELSSALNAPTETMKIQQIMEDPAFSNISDRRIGWQSRLGYSQLLLSDDKTEGSAVINLDYAKPIGLDKQLIVGLEILGSDETSLTGSYTIDHSITWVSSASFKMDDNNSNIELNTTKVLINKITGTASLQFEQPKDGDLSINFNILFNYFAF